MIKEEPPLFVSDDWKNNSLRGLTQRYMILSKIDWNDKTTTVSLESLMVSICLKTRSYPKLNQKCENLLERFRQYHDIEGITEPDAET